MKYTYNIDDTYDMHAHAARSYNLYVYVHMYIHTTDTVFI